MFEAPNKGMWGLLPAPVGVRNWVEYFLFSGEGCGIGSCQEWPESRLVLVLAVREEGGSPSTVVVVVVVVVPSGLNRDNGGVGRPWMPWMPWIPGITVDPRVFSNGLDVAAQAPAPVPAAGSSLGSYTAPNPVLTRLDASGCWAAW
jgi:hypothetical protein